MTDTPYTDLAIWAQPRPCPLRRNTLVALQQERYPQENYRAILHAQWRERRMRQEAKAAEFQRELAAQERVREYSSAKAVLQRAIAAELRKSEVIASLVDRAQKIVDKAAPEGCVRISTIQAIVADHYAVSKADMLGSRRFKRLTHPRMVAMYFSRMMSKHTVEELGNLFGGRDHTTVVHACKTIPALIEANPLIAADVAAIRAKIEARK